MFRGLASLRQRMQWLDQLGERAISVVHAQRFRDQAARFQAVARTDADGPEQIADLGLTCEHRGDAAPPQTQRRETLNRKSVVEGKGGSCRVKFGGCRIIKKKKKKKK